MSVHIYGLIDPRDKALRYIGKTINVSRRYIKHLLPSSLQEMTHKNRWLITLLAAGVKPEIIILDIVSDDFANETEEFFISYMKYIGCDLTNGTPGGDGRSGFITPTSVKSKISQSMKGKNTKPRIKANCLFCNTEFTFLAKYLKRGHKFCSLKCANKLNNLKRANMSI